MLERVKTRTNNQFVEQAPEFVAAPAIARRLSVTGRYVLQLAEQGRIPCLRLGRKCVRFNYDAVAEALGIQWKEEVQ